MKKQQVARKKKRSESSEYRDRERKKDQEARKKKRAKSSDTETVKRRKTKKQGRRNALSLQIQRQ